MTIENAYQTPASELLHEQSEPIQYAGFWIRAVASLIDSILLMVITLPLLTAIYGSEYWTGMAMVKGVWEIIISYLLPAVATVVFWVYKSATPGKMILGLKVISLHKDGKLTSGQSTGRYVSYYLSLLPFALGFIWVAFDKRKQGWHDKIAKTAVIYSK